MTRRTRQILALAPVLALAVGACTGGGDAAPESTPEGAVVLSENQPGSVEGTQVVATSVDGEDATLQITVDGTARPTDVTEGGPVDIAGSGYRVEAVWSEGDGDEPGSRGGRVMVVPTSG